MLSESARRFLCLLIAAGIAGCMGGGEDVADTAASGPARVEQAGSASSTPADGRPRWRRDAYRELDGDEENAERLVAIVNDGPLDSTFVRLEIRTSKDRLLYRSEWPATSYMMYGDEGSAKDSVAVLRETERQIKRIFADSAFITGEAARVRGQPEMHMEAIRRDLAEHDYRAREGLKRWEPLPRGSYDAIVSIARTIPAARVQAVAAETRAGPAFRYYAGGEETYVVAWSPSEERMVRIFACC